MGLLDLLGLQVALWLGLREFGAMANGPDDRPRQPCGCYTGRAYPRDRYSASSKYIPAN